MVRSPSDANILFGGSSLDAGITDGWEPAFVIHNGVVVQHGESYMGPTKWKQLASYPKNHPATDPIGLQFHGDPMEFRNIWVRPLGSRK